MCEIVFVQYLTFHVHCASKYFGGQLLEEPLSLCLGQLLQAGTDLCASPAPQLDFNAGLQTSVLAEEQVTNRHAAFTHVTVDSNLFESRTVIGG